LHDRRAQVDRAGLRRQPGEHADHVGAVGLGRPDRLEAGRLGGLHDLDRVVASGADAPVAEVESEFERHPPGTLLNVGMASKAPTSTGAPGAAEQGLSSAEAAARLRKLGAPPDSSSRSVSSIVAGNVFTLFNAIIGVFFVLILSLGLIADAVFGVIAI